MRLQAIQVTEGRARQRKFKIILGRGTAACVCRGTIPFSVFVFRIKNGKISAKYKLFGNHAHARKNARTRGNQKPRLRKRHNNKRMGSTDFSAGGRALRQLNAACHLKHRLIRKYTERVERSNADSNFKKIAEKI